MLSWGKGCFPCPQGGAVMQKLESIRVEQALSSSSPVVFRSKDTREQRGDHCGDHRLHPRGGCTGVCHLLPPQERQDPMWPRWETGHVSTAARPPREPLGLEVLAITHASHLIAPAAPCPTRREAIVQPQGAVCWGLSSASSFPQPGVCTANPVHAVRR